MGSTATSPSLMFHPLNVRVYLVLLYKYHLVLLSPIISISCNNAYSNREIYSTVGDYCQVSSSDLSVRSCVTAILSKQRIARVAYVTKREKPESHVKYHPWEMQRKRSGRGRNYCIAGNTFFRGEHANSLEYNKTLRWLTKLMLQADLYEESLANDKVECSRFSRVFQRKFVATDVLIMLNAA